MMDAFAQSSEDSPIRAELSGVLLESVEEVRREPIAEQDLVRALERARRLGGPTTRRRLWSRRRLLLGAAVATTLLVAMFTWWEWHSVAWSQVVETVQGRPWIHGSSKGPDGQQHEFWFSTIRDVSASRHGQSVHYDDHRLRIRYTYDPKDKQLYRVPHSHSRTEYHSFKMMFQAIFRGEAALESPIPSLEVVQQQQRRIKENGREWIEYDLTLRRQTRLPKDNDVMRMVFRVDPDSLLPQRMALSTLNKEPPESIEFLLDYPKTGPVDVYALGVPRSAQLVDRVPNDDLARLIEGSKASLQRFDDYQALVLDGEVIESRTRPGKFHTLPSLYRIFRKGRRWRLEFGQFRLDAKWPKPPAPSADMHEWVKDYSQRLDFVPISICDGTTIYNAHLTHPKGPKPELQKVERWEAKRKLQTDRGIAAGRSDHARWFRPEFYAYPSLPIGQKYEVVVDAKPQTGPANTVLVRCRSTTKQGPRLNRTARYWIDPSRSFVTMKWETVRSAGDKPMPYIMEKLDKTPQGLWYPTVMRWKTGRLHTDGKTMIRDKVKQFYLDFKTDLPDSLFKVAQ